MSQDGLIATLKAMQKIHRWTDGTMGAKLGISRSYWVRLRSGARQPGRAVFVGVVKSFPELEGEAIEQLRRM